MKHFCKIIAVITLLLAGYTAMANDYYTPTGAPASNSAGSSAVMRAEFVA